MGRFGYYSKLSGQVPQESDPPKNFPIRWIVTYIVDSAIRQRLKNWN